MLKNTFLLLLALIAVTLSSCVQELPPIVGGYSDATKTPEGRKAAEFAVRQQAAQSGEKLSLVAVVQSQRQIVAGSNYRMTLQVKAGRQVRLAEAEVYQSLAPQLMLMSWKWLDGVEAPATR